MSFDLGDLGDLSNPHEWARGTGAVTEADKSRQPRHYSQKMINAIRFKVHEKAIAAGQHSILKLLAPSSKSSNRASAPGYVGGK